MAKNSAMLRKQNDSVETHKTTLKQDLFPMPPLGELGRTLKTYPNCIVLVIFQLIGSPGDLKKLASKNSYQRDLGHCISTTLKKKTN